MADEEWLKAHSPVAPRQPTPGERLFEFRRGLDHFRCELRDHGEVLGVEAQFYRNEEFFASRRFDASMSRTQTPQTLAIQWADQERKAIESFNVSETNMSR